MCLSTVCRAFYSLITTAFLMPKFRKSAVASSQRMESIDKVDEERPHAAQQGGEQLQDAQQDGTKSPLMDLYSCTHDIAPALREKLVDREACPACLVNYHIKMIEDLQEMLHKRGGIFLSKSSDPADESIISHKNCIRLWTVVKIECYQDVSLLETICRDDLQRGEQWGIQEALHRWYQAHSQLTSVPGCHNGYDKKIEASKEDGPEADFTVDQLLDTRESNDHDENADAEQDEASLQDKKETPLSTTEATPSPKDEDAPSTKYGAPKDVQDVTQQLDQSNSLEDWVIFDAAANLSTPLDAPLTPSSPPAPSTTRSAFKGSRPSTPASRPRTTFTGQATIIAPNFRYSGSTDHKPHNAHTSAEEARRQPHFHRPSATYEPATWSSPEGEEKENTSHYKTSWYRYEMVMEIGKWEKKPPAVRKSNNPLSAYTAEIIAGKVKETEEWLLTKNRATAKRREQFAAKHGTRWEERLDELKKKQRKGSEQGESSKAMEGTGLNDGEAERTENIGGKKYSALDPGVGEPESER